MFKRKDCCVCSRCEKREKELFFIELYDFLSRKIHLELLQYFLYLEKHCSNFKKKKKIGKVLHLENLLELIFGVCSPKNKFS